MIEPVATGKEGFDLVIVGAGLGGIATAISCATSHHSVLVLEQSKEITEIGAGVQITPNGSRLLQQWKLPESFWKTVAKPSSITVHRFSGEVLEHYEDLQTTMQDRYEAPFFSVHRADLQKALYNRARELGVQFALDQKVISLDCSRERPELMTASGKLFTADLIIAADGLWSQCRSVLPGGTAPPKPTGDMAYRIVLTLDQVDDLELRALIKDPKVHLWAGPGSHVVSYSLRDGEMYNIVLLTPDDDLLSPIAKQAGSADQMRALFEGWDPILQKFLGYVQSVDKWKLMHREEMPHWINKEENLVLIGDSCHPMLPYLAQGTNSALEDGAVLGTLLAQVKTKPQLGHALRRYESLRKKRGHVIAAEAFAQRDQWHMPDGEPQQARDAILRRGVGAADPMIPYPSRWMCPTFQPWLFGYFAIEDAIHDCADESAGKAV